MPTVMLVCWWIMTGKTLTIGIFLSKSQLQSIRLYFASTQNQTNLNRPFVLFVVMLVRKAISLVQIAIYLYRILQKIFRSIYSWKMDRLISQENRFQTINYSLIQVKQFLLHLKCIEVLFMIYIPSLLYSIIFYLGQKQNMYFRVIFMLDCLVYPRKDILLIVHFYYYTGVPPSLILLFWNIAMQISLDEMGFQISANLLHDYVLQKQQSLIQLQQQFAHEFVIQKETDLHMWLMDYIKKINVNVTHLCDGVKDYLEQIRLPFLFSFFQKCIDMQSQSCKYLIQALTERINKKIDFTVDPPIIQSKFSTVEATQKQESSSEDKRRISRQAGKDLQSLDYFLNLLSYEDNKNYEEYRSHCDKLLIQRQLVENIKPSQASRQIIQTANMIQDVMNSTDKLFKESYLLKYMQFKTFLSNIPEPQTLQTLFRDEMGKATRDKFRQGITRTLKNMVRANHQHQLRKLIATASQTEESRNKIQDKWQNLLVIEKKNNQKLTLQLQKLKKNSSNSQDDHSQILHRLQEEQSVRKELQSKYQILQTMYNQKCNQMRNQQPKLIIQKQKVSTLLIRAQKSFKNQKIERKFMDSYGTQTKEIFTQLEAFCQTDMDFYYYFQCSKISDLQHRCGELERLLRQKEYIIEEMRAIKTFRDNFKSKTEIYSTVVKSHKVISIAKSLRYLQEDEEIYDEKQEEKKEKNSIERMERTILKKQVTFEQTPIQNIITKEQLALRNKNQKKTEMIKNKPYFAFNDKIEEEQTQDILKKRSQYERVHQISLRSILKYGSQSFKIDFAVQTDFLQGDSIIISDSQINSEKNNNLEKTNKDQNNKIQETITNKKNIRISQTSQISKSIRERIKPNSKKQRKSNFISFQGLNNQKSENAASLIPRVSDFASPALNKIISQKAKPLQRISKRHQNKSNINIVKNEVLPLTNQVLHVNNSLNFSLFEPLGNTTQPSFGKPALIKNNRTDQNNMGRNVKKIL